MVALAYAEGHAIHTRKAEPKRPFPPLSFRITHWKTYAEGHSFTKNGYFLLHMEGS